MKKRSKILLSISMCAISLAILVYGVWAATTAVKFNVIGQLNFNPTGVFASISGDVYAGTAANDADLEKLTGDGFTYSGENYDKDANGDPLGQYKDHFGESSGDDWVIPGDGFNFSDEDGYRVLIKITVVNKSAFSIDFSLDSTSSTTAHDNFDFEFNGGTSSITVLPDGMAEYVIEIRPTTFNIVVRDAIFEFNFNITPA